MSYRIALIICTSLIGGVSCKEDCVDPTGPITIEARSYNEIINSIDDQYLEEALIIPTEEGAIGRNVDAYFHVRFQLGMNTISDYAITQQRLDALETSVKTIEYAFSFQKPEGDFELVIPANLQNIGQPFAADLASGVAFFGSSLGLSLLSLSQSDWYNTSTSTLPSKNIIESYRLNYQSMLDYLKSSKEMLLQVDQAAPNRLLFNAVAFQSLGVYLSDSEAQTIAKEFAEKALTLQDETEGYYIEGGGWDSSYNGVAIQLGLELLMILELSELRNRLQDSLERSIAWQLTRIQSSGEINTEGNTRVFEGGESFLGREKGVDYPKTVKSFLYLAELTDDPQYEEIADRILNFYN